MEDSVKPQIPNHKSRKHDDDIEPAQDSEIDDTDVIVPPHLQDLVQQCCKRWSHSQQKQIKEQLSM